MVRYAYSVWLRQANVFLEDIRYKQTESAAQSLSVLVEDTGSDATSYIDADVAAGTKYVYRVKAINEAGVGSESRRVVTTTSQ